jgi:DNA repair protein RecO (recombination protein O)
MLYKTKGIVLRSVKYRETSLVVTIFTEMFGLQTYLANGARSSKTRSAKANWLQPSNILDMVVYHNEQKNMQRIAECRFSHLYQSVHFDVIKNSIALFLIELLLHSLKQPEQHEELYFLAEKTLIALDEPAGKIANLPLYFILKTGAGLGFGLNGMYSNATPYLDLKEGNFIAQIPAHPYYLDSALSEYTWKMMQVNLPEDAAMIALNQSARRKMLTAYLDYFALHLPDFTPLKSVAILQEILG